MVNVGIMAIMNEHDLAIEFRASTTARLDALLAGQERIEKSLVYCQTNGGSFCRETRAKVDAIGDKGWLGKVLGLIVAVFSGIFGRKG